MVSRKTTRDREAQALELSARGQKPGKPWEEKS